MKYTFYFQPLLFTYKLISILLILIIPLLILGCSTASSSFTKKATQLGFRTLLIQGENFKHTIYKNNINHKNILHVYLGSDGTPWFKGRYISNDATPLNPVMLRLMKMDTHPAIYLGRPCYHQHRMPDECNNTLWTNKRYSLPIVNSMVVALKHYIQQHTYNETDKNITLNLFGFSGGGTLAMLIAPRLPQVSTVVTLAGNLDTDRWASHHGYLPLTGSLNPAKQTILSAHIQQFHLLANLDKTVPNFITKPIILKQKNTRYRVLENADHHCCWQSEWLSVLKNINQSQH